MGTNGGLANEVWVDAGDDILNHSDPWSFPMLGGRGGRLVLIDPAVTYTWAEVDLSMLWCDT